MVERVDAVVARATVDAAGRPPDLARAAVLDLHVTPSHAHRFDVAEHCVVVVVLLRLSVRVCGGQTFVLIFCVQRVLSRQDAWV